MDPFLEAAFAANRAIAAYVAEGLSPNDRREGAVGAGGDRSSGIDLKAEAILIEHLRPFGRIDSEESGSVGTGEHTVVLDPIDGSSNLLSGFPYYGTSAALIDADGTPVAAAVCNLAAGEFFGYRAHRPPLALRLADGEPLARFEAVPDAKIGLFERAYAHPDTVRALGEADLKFRAPGAVALSLVYARTARYFLYVGSYRRYDFAAGLAFCADMEVEAKEDYVIVTHTKAMLERLRTIVHRTKE
jgi:myo-inositol-1(or 4)-monophosphatase